MFIKVLSVSIDENVIVSCIQSTLDNVELAYKMLDRYNLLDVERLFTENCQQLFENGDYDEAARVIVPAPRVHLLNSKDSFFVYYVSFH